MFMHPADAVLLRRSLRRVVPSLFLAGVVMEAFMIYVPIGGRTFYDVAKEKEAERRAEGGRVRDILRMAATPPPPPPPLPVGVDPPQPRGDADDSGRLTPAATSHQQQPAPPMSSTAAASAERPRSRSGGGE
ncbi:hypothetical protein MMPV_001737 [Pyropia vietnamensis]